MYRASFSQWQRALSGLVTGLNYAGIESLMRMKGIEDIEDTFERLQVLEKETRAIALDQAKAKQ